MASVYKRKRDRARKGSSWYVAYADENGKRQTEKGYPDKAATEALGRKLETEADRRRRGDIDPKSQGYATNRSTAVERTLGRLEGILAGQRFNSTARKRRACESGEAYGRGQGGSSKRTDSLAASGRARDLEGQRTIAPDCPPLHSTGEELHTLGVA